MLSYILVYCYIIIIIVVLYIVIYINENNKPQVELIINIINMHRSMMYHTLASYLHIYNTAQL